MLWIFVLFSTVTNFDVDFQIQILKGHLCMCPLDTSFLIWQTKLSFLELLMGITKYKSLPFSRVVKESVSY